MKSNDQPKFVHQIILNDDRTHENVQSLDNTNLENDQTVWQHIDLSDQGSYEWIHMQENLEESIVSALCAEETRPRSFKTKKGILIVLRGVNTNPGHDPEDMVSIRVWLEEKRIISVRRRPVISVQDILEDLAQGAGPRKSGEFFTELVDKLADRIGDFVTRIDEELSDVEDKLESTSPDELRSVLGPLRKQIATVRRYLAPQRDALDRLNLIETTIFNDRDRQILRDESDRISRYLEDLDLGRERAVVLQEAFLVQIAQQQNNRVYALSIITAVFLPLGFLTGLLGINVGGVPGVDNPNAFWIFLGLLIFVVGGLLMWFKKTKWL